MKNNAFINCRLKDLLQILDARSYIDIFTSETELLKSGYVYKFLADTEFLKEYGLNFYVTGLTAGLTTTILISKEADE